MNGLGFALLAVLGYPILVAWLVGLRKASRISGLERQLEALNERVRLLASPPPLATPEPRPVYVPVKVQPPDIATPSPPAPRAEDRPETLAPQSNRSNRRHRSLPKPMTQMSVQPITNQLPILSRNVQHHAG